MKTEKPTDTEVAEISDLLVRIQAILEDREKNYSPLSVINVLINLASRYAAAMKWPLRNYIKTCGSTYRAQLAAVEGMERDRTVKNAEA
jgi:hypothetical protein